MRSHLRRRPVTAIEAARTAHEAFNREPFDGLLADIGMPDQDGWSLIETIRRMRLECGGRIAAAAVTGASSPADVARSIAAGFDEQLTKPVQVEQLVATTARLAGFAPRLTRAAR